MCAHYESVQSKTRLKVHFGVDLPSELARRDVWPCYLSTFIRRHPHADVGDEDPAREDHRRTGRGGASSERPLSRAFL